MFALVLTFTLALTLSFSVVLFATRPTSPSRSLRQRLVTIQHPARSEKSESGKIKLENPEQRDYFSRLGDFIKQYAFSRNIHTLLIHANSTMSIGSAILASAGAALGCTLVAFLFLPILPLDLVAFAIGAVAPFIVLKFKRSRRLKAFNEALPDAIDLMSRALRAGHSIGSSIEVIAEQSPEPLAGEFSRVYQQQKFGIRFREAVLQMGERIPSRDLQFLITAILVQKETGGDLTEILDRASHVIRERIRIQAEVRTHTAQGRLTGWILGLLPLIMLALINIVSPGYSSLLFHDPTGQKLLYAGATLIVIGFLIIRKIVDVQV